MAILDTIIAIVTAAIGFVIVDEVLKAQTFNSSLANTIKDYVVPIGIIGLMALAAFMASGR